MNDDNLFVKKLLKKFRENKTMKKIIIIILVLLMTGFGVWHFFVNPSSGVESQYQFVKVERSNLENIVSSTGTIEAVNTVEIGTQVSGIIKNIYVDFNTMVSKGQLLAVLDTATLVSKVREDEASLFRAEAQYNQSLSEYNRNKPLFEKGFLSEKEFVPIKTDLEVNRASLQTAQVNLDRSNINLQYAWIRSPINGIIINRNIEMGQTVAASFQTPTLFIVAEDLSRMRILADVDESDIGQIKEGMGVRFTVQTYMDEVFYGTVKQIRLQPKTIQNVVNYTVVVDAPNEKGLLMPGMTATVDFIIENIKDVLLIPNAALRFEPSTEMMAELRKTSENRMKSLPDSLQKKEVSFRGMMQFPEISGGLGGLQNEKTQKDFGRLWYVNEMGNIGMKRIHTGITDGIKTEIKMSQGIEEGMTFISGITKKGKNGSQSNSNTGNSTQRPPGPPGMRIF